MRTSPQRNPSKLRNFKTRKSSRLDERRRRRSFKRFALLESSLPCFSSQLAQKVENFRFSHSVIVHRLLHLCSKMKWQLLDCVSCAFLGGTRGRNNFFTFPWRCDLSRSPPLALPLPQGKGNNSDIISSRTPRRGKTSLALQQKHDATKGFRYEKIKIHLI